MATKPRSVAAINASPKQREIRHIGRIKTLRLAIEKAKGRKQKDRVKSLQDEMERRVTELKDNRASIDAALAELDAD